LNNEYRFGDEIRREWRVLVATIMGMSCAIATLGLPYSIGVMIEPLRREFGWTVAEIMGVQPIAAVSVVLMSAVVGYWVDRRSARPLIIASHIGFGSSMVALGLLTHSIWSFYGIYCIAALLGGGMLAVSYMKMVVPRFDRERGLAVGISLIGSGLSSFLYQPQLVRIVDRWGWRAGYVAIGLLILLVALPIALAWARDPPRTMAAADAKILEDQLPGLSLGQALRGYRFWVLFGIFFLFSGGITGVLNNFVAILTELGYSRSAAGDTAGMVFGLSLILGRIFIGLMLDRIWAPLVGCIFFLASASGIALLGQPGFGPDSHRFFIALCGLAAGAEVDLMAYLVSRYFGVRALGKIYGGVYIAFALGPGPLVPAFGWLRDTTGSYQTGLLWVGVSLGCAGLLLLTLGPFPAAFRPRH
jgi:predicted MFS family arabinose efflux permease